VYLHVFNWPSDGRLQVPSWGSTVKRAYLLANPKHGLKFAIDSAGVTLQLPTTAPDPIASVIVLEHTQNRER
jgi:alpha-L-fucosidase